MQYLQYASWCHIDCGNNLMCNIDIDNYQFQGDNHTANKVNYQVLQIINNKVTHVSLS